MAPADDFRPPAWLRSPPSAIHACQHGRAARPDRAPCRAADGRATGNAARLRRRRTAAVLSLDSTAAAAAFPWCCCMVGRGARSRCTCSRWASSSSSAASTSCGSICAITATPTISTAGSSTPACCRRWSARCSALQSQLGGKPLRLVGFSLGGNFMLRVGARGARRESRPGADHRGVAGVGSDRYAARAGERLHRLSGLFRAQVVALAAEEAGGVAGALRFRAVAPRARSAGPDRGAHSPLHGFRHLEEYLDGYSITGERLRGLEVPSTIFTSLDDPIIPAGGLERLAQPPALRIVVTRFGGHCGFLDRLTGPTWVERRILAELDAGEPPAALDPVLTGA